MKDGQIRNGAPHTHTPNPALNESYKVMTTIREQAQTTLNQPQQILGIALAGVTDSVAAELPSIPVARRNIRRQTESGRQRTTCTRNPRNSTKSDSTRVHDYKRRCTVSSIRQWGSGSHTDLCHRCEVNVIGK